MKIVREDHHSWGEFEGVSEEKSQEGCCEEGPKEHCLGPRCAKEQEYGAGLQGRA